MLKWVLISLGAVGLLAVIWPLLPFIFAIIIALVCYRFLFGSF